jgi:hypothetical protein
MRTTGFVVTGWGRLSFPTLAPQYLEEVCGVGHAVVILGSSVGHRLEKWASFSQI